MANPPKPGEYNPTEHLTGPEVPRHLHYVENLADVEKYQDAATVEAVVQIDRIHFDEGRSWGFYGETVHLSERDAKALEKRGQITVVSRKDAKK